MSSAVPLGRTGTPAARAVSFAASLSPPGPQRRGRRSDPRQPGLEHGLGELGALGEEAVAGMDGVGARLARGAHVLGRVEIGGDLDDRVRRLRMERAVVVGAATATVSMPSARQARKMRSAISPRLATSRRRIGPESRLRQAE